MSDSGKSTVTVLPITHRVPANPGAAIEIPAPTKVRLKLDDERSWIVLTEANRFVWPGPDLRRAVPGETGSVAFGFLPRRLSEEMRLKFLELVKARKTKLVQRDE
jgi:hypothetical protein